MRTRLLALLVLPLVGCASATPPAGVEARIDAILAEYAAAGAPGASVLVRHDGRIVVAKGIGLADLENRTAATATTNYRLASVTKQFTAMAILILADEGKLSLGDSIGRWLGDLPSWGEGVTIRHLLTHTSGIVDYEDLIAKDATRQVLDRDVLDLLAAQNDRYFAPGTSYRYSNSGYALLALIVERASGMPFQDVLRQRIFAPVGMRATLAYLQDGPPVEQRAFGHSRSGDGWVRDDQSITSAVLGDGGIYSSVRDLAAWDAELDRPTLIPARLLEEAFTPATATDVAGVSYGYGWRIGELAGKRMLHHTGETRGFRNALLRIPSERLTVVVL
ncbi:MAG TPA: serine hydrolase domain-containing protein, partial [Thermoanaerobaculia bacterium]